MLADGYTKKHTGKLHGIPYDERPLMHYSYILLCTVCLEKILFERNEL